MLKKTIISFYIVVVAVMATTTIIEKYQGTDFVQTHCYGSWWFALLWALLAAAGIAWIVKQKMRRWNIVLLHLALVLILAGALLTHLYSRQGSIHLRVGEKTDTWIPFTIRLDAFDIQYHEGTTAATDYVSQITVIDGAHHEKGNISMNNVFIYKGYRFYQSSYDDDEKGTILAVNSDPWGIPVTYTGYALLFFSLIYMLIDPKGTFRQILRSPALKEGLLMLFLFFQSTALPAQIQSGNSYKTPAEKVLTVDNAEQFGKLLMKYNDRICPLQTYALDFTQKLYGKRSYNGYTAEQVLTGFIFWSNEWSNEPILKIKGNELREELQLNEYCSVNDLFSQEKGYLLGPYIHQYYQGSTEEIYKQAAKLDDKLQLIMELRKGKPLAVFPVTSKEAVGWYAPTDKLPDDTNQKNKEFIQLAFNILYQDALTQNHEHFNGVISDMRKFQYNNGKGSLPSATKIQAERLYNRIPFATILFMFNLTMGFVTLFLFIWQLTKKTLPKKKSTAIRLLLPIILGLSFLSLSLCLALRWIVSGNIPMANGYETMLLMAWFVMILALICWHRFRIVLVFGFLLSGFFLLVSHISQMDPQIGQVMPVLNSPLLSIHVSIIMMAYALLSLTFICGITAVILNHFSKQSIQSLHKLSLLFLYPALTCLGLGIFIGAIWANISWGQYWSWDPKETWALITLMVYAAPIHAASLPLFRKPIAYHLYMTVAFLTILMTYFGVNYFLGGMHSYA